MNCSLNANVAEINLQSRRTPVEHNTQMYVSVQLSAIPLSSRSSAFSSLSVLELFSLLVAEEHWDSDPGFFQALGSQEPIRPGDDGGDDAEFERVLQTSVKLYR